MPQRTRFVLWACLALASAWVTGGCRPVTLPVTLPPATLPAVPTDNHATDNRAADNRATQDTVMITLARPDAAATVRTLDGRLLVEIESPSGIGAATLVWQAPPAAPAVLRLHLGGLEELRLTKGSDELVASVSSSPPHTVSQSTRSTAAGELQPLTADQEGWLDISWSAGGTGAPVDPEAMTFPLQDGYFDIVLGAGPWVEPGTSLEIRWIDFYR